MVFFVMVGFPQLECFIITVMLIESLNVLFWSKLSYIICGWIYENRFYRPRQEV